MKFSLHPMSESLVRCVVVVSGQHSEVASAEMLLRTQAIAVDARILLPPALHAVHRASFGTRAAPYASLADIKGVVAAHDPQIVFLCSAYLFALDKTLSRREVSELLDFLRLRGCRIATTDPLVGLAGRLTLRDVDTRYLLPGEAAWKRALAAAAARIARSHKLVPVPRMDDVIHVYPGGAPDIDDGVQRASFFAPPAPHAHEAERTPPNWLFLLSEVDLHAQLVETDLRGFVENILGLLRFAVAEGVKPTLIAPAMIVELLAGAMSADMQLHQILPIVEFRRRILDAEYVFSWNAFSPSQLDRLASELPVFFFDRGFLSRAVKPFYDAAQACHFGGWEPRYLDQRQLFSPYVLAHLAKQQLPAVRALRERWSRSPSPDDLMRQLVGTAERSRTG